MSFKDVLQAQKHGIEGMASTGVIGMHMVSGPLVGVAIGYFLDKWLGTGPWLKLAFLIIGVGAGFLNVYVDTKGLVDKMNRDALKRPGSVLKISPEGEPQNKDESEDGGKQSERRP